MVEQVIHARRGKYGSRRIRQELTDKGIDAERIAAAMAQLKQDETAAAAAVWRRKFGNPPRDAAERARQIRFMQGRGFALETVLRVLKQGAGDEDE